MDCYRRPQKSKSLLSIAKNFAIQRYYLIFASALLVSCAGTPSTPGAVPPPDYLLTDGVKQLTFIGENDSAQFSPDGNKIIYISRKRSHHKNSQVYEMNLQKNTERRVTFQDGEIRNPTYINDNEIVYASNTDEIKESLIELGTAVTSPDKPALELYQSDLYGNDIERLTSFPGYDDEPVFVSDKRPYLLFTSFRGGLLGIFKYDFKVKSSSFYLLEKNKERRSPTISYSTKFLAWLEKDTGGTGSRIMMSSTQDLKPKTLKTETAELRDLRFVPKTTKLIYSIKPKDQDLYRIQIYDFEKNCTQVLFSGRDSLIQASINATNNRILFTRVLKDTRQIYLVDFPEKLGPCLEATP